MDASQCKDYVLVLLFIKYISDKYASQPFAPITIPEGASFKDMVALKGKSDIGDQINKKIIAPLAIANQQLSQSDFDHLRTSNPIESVFATVRHRTVRTKGSPGGEDCQVDGV